MNFNFKNLPFKNIYSAFFTIYNSPNRRKDIDGLRSIAIILVIMNHLGIQKFSAGFIGVDIFYVISGYLVTNIILKEQGSDGFNFLKFYERRFRRIIPAFTITVLLTLFFGVFILLPPELYLLGKQTFFSTLFISNIFLYSITDYFSDFSKTLLLLHTWSLSLEEQFYIFFPILFIVLSRFGNFILKISIILVFFTSLLFSQFQISFDKAGAFYLLPARIWELLLGTLVALNLFRLPKHPIITTLQPILGTVLILLNLFYLNSNSDFPGIAVLPACLGVALIISFQSCSSTVAFHARVLSIWPIQMIGLLSYSLYLVHWPLITLYKIYFHSKITFFDQIILFLISIGLALFIFLLIEIPFRHLSPFKNLKILFTNLACLSAFILLFSIFLIYTDGLKFIYSQKENLISSYLNYDDTDQFRRGKCFLTNKENFKRDFDKVNCLNLDSNKKNYLIIGDSHAAHLWFGFKNVFRNLNFLQLTSAGCNFTVRLRDDNCNELFNFIEKDFYPSSSIDGIIFSFRWSNSYVKDLQHYLLLGEKFSKDIYYVGPIVEYDLPLPRLIIRSGRANNPEFFVNYISTHQGNTINYIDKELKILSEKYGMRYLSLIDIFCPRGKCISLTDDGKPVQFDYGHLTAEGSIFLARQFEMLGYF